MRADRTGPGTPAGAPPALGTIAATVASDPSVLHPQSSPAGGPRVSVLVRSLGRLPLLQEALDSIAAQTWPHVEVVVVAVHPDHPPLPERVGAHPLRLVAATETRPRSRAANVALDHAQGDWLLFLDDDDWLMPSHLQRLLAAALPHPDVRAAYAGVALVDECGQPQGQVFDLPFSATRQLAGNLTPIHAVLFKRDLLQRGCRFDEALDRFEDWDFWLQVARHTVMLHVPGVSAVYRIHDSSGVHAESTTSGPTAARLHDKWLSLQARGARAEVLQRAWAYDELRVQLDAAQAQAAHAAQAHVAERDALAGRITGLAGEVQTMQHALGAAQADAQALSMEVGRQQDSLRTLQQLLDEQAAHAEQLRGDLQALRRSTSWRLTAPLRALIDLLRGTAPATLPAAAQGTLARLLQHWRAHGTRATVQRVQQRLAAGAPAEAPTLAPPIAHASGTAEVHFYVVPDYGQPRLTAVLDRLATEAEALVLQERLLLLVAWANRRDARLRLIAREGAIDGRWLDTLLQRHGLALQRDSLLLSAEAPDAEFDRSDGEMICALSAAALQACRASVPPARLVWMGSGAAPVDAAGVHQLAVPDGAWRDVAQGLGPVHDALPDAGAQP